MTTTKVLRKYAQAKEKLDQLRASDDEWRYEMRPAWGDLRLFYIAVFDEEDYFLGYL